MTGSAKTEQQTCSSWQVESMIHHPTPLSLRVKGHSAKFAEEISRFVMS